MTAATATVTPEIIDCHTHIIEKHDAAAGDRLLALARKGGLAAINILALGELTWGEGNAPGLVAKARHPQEIYLFAGLDYSILAGEAGPSHLLPFFEQVARLRAMGCDGLKMINGKPDFRRNAGLALDSPIYDKCFRQLASLGLPLLWHVNDPEEFWDPQLAPEWAKAPGWLYDERHPSKESIHAETERMLARHPEVKVIFAHFYFLSADLPRAARLLERFPNVHLDLAPGIEMFHNFSANLAAARDFFLRYQDRILFGSDLVEGSPLSRVEVVRRCLETDDVFHVPTDESLFWPDHRTILRGLKLPPSVLAKVYAGNFRRLAGDHPRPLDLAAVRAELARLSAIAEQLGKSPNLAQQALATLG